MQYDDGDWKELRGRVDSLASTVFLIAGGALTLSISILLKLMETNPHIKSYAGEITDSWVTLLFSIICFVILKVWLIAQSFARGLMKPEKYNPTIKYTNSVGWVIGLLGLFAFIYGMYKLVAVAAGVAHA